MYPHSTSVTFTLYLLSMCVCVCVLPVLLHKCAFPSFLWIQVVQIQVAIGCCYQQPGNLLNANLKQQKKQQHWIQNYNIYLIWWLLNIYLLGSHFSLASVMFWSILLMVTQLLLRLLQVQEKLYIKHLLRCEVIHILQKQQQRILCNKEQKR